MFSGCNKLKELDLSNLKTIYKVNLDYIFEDCSSLKEVKSSDIRIKYRINDLCFIC